MSDKEYISACCRKSMEDYDKKSKLGYCPKCGHLASALIPDVPKKSILSKLDFEMLATPTELLLLRGILTLNHIFD